MTRTSRRSCQSPHCGESDGKVEKVVIQAGGRKVFGIRLCLHCRTVLVIRLFAKEKHL